jgi:hypothetical protein
VILATALNNWWEVPWQLPMICSYIQSRYAGTICTISSWSTWDYVYIHTYCTYIYIHTYIYSTIVRDQTWTQIESPPKIRDPRWPWHRCQTLSRRCHRPQPSQQQSGTSAQVAPGDPWGGEKVGMSPSNWGPKYPAW